MPLSNPLAIIIIIIWVYSGIPFPTPAFSDPSDESCLSALLASLSDQSSNGLRNWTTTNLATPCNGVTSYISGAVCNNNRIFKLSLPGLSLSGSIPPLISNCTGLQSLDLSSNRLSGPIPPQISSLLNLAVLNLSSNLLSSRIPPDLALSAYLNVIDLHSNDLSGPIPDQLASLARLTVLDLSGNRLEGMVPVGLGRRFNESTFRGNDDLYGFPLKKTGGVEGKGLSVWGIVGIGLASGMLSLVVSFSAVCIWLRVTEKRNGGDGSGGGDDGGKISHYMSEY